MKHLDLLTYQLLLEQPRTGYGLAKEVEERTGWKPSYGSIYPLLEQLETDGHATVEEDGRRKEYALTEKGKAHARKALEEVTQIYDELIERLRTLQVFCDDDLSMPITYLEQRKRGTDPLSPVKQEITTLRNTLIQLWQKDTIGNNAKDINDILKRANNQLNSL